MWNSFERDYTRFLAKRDQNIFARFIKTILRLFSWLYRLFVSLRNRAFDNGWLTVYYSPIPLVVSIGNIVAGGTGKTPFVSLLAEELAKELRIAILSRGYRSMAEHLEMPFFLSKGEGPLFPSSYGGDEPYLLACHIPQALVVVGTDRSLSAKMAAKASAQAAIIDDGMQHRWLYRDYDIVIVNAKDPFGLGYFLPRGLLRDSPYSLKRAALIVVTNYGSNEEKMAVSAKLRYYSDAPIIGMKTKVAGVYNLKNEEIGDGTKEKPLEGISVAAFCGIAPSELFCYVGGVWSQCCYETHFARPRFFKRKQCSKICRRGQAAWRLMAYLHGERQS
jgi:tetraacyldisaccharide 4'-kinase